MSAAFDAVRAIAMGRKPVDFALLQNTRFEGLGARAFGREPILGLFAHAPLEVTNLSEVHETPRNLLVVEGDSALFADLQDGRVVRLWALGASEAGAPEPSISVARDLDLSQFEDDVFFDPANHPDLAPDDSPALRSVAVALTKPEVQAGGLAIPNVFSCRAFVTRAFSARGHVCALIVLAGASDVTRRRPFSVNAALTFASGDGAGHTAKLVIDEAGFQACRDAEWTPRIASAAPPC